MELKGIVKRLEFNKRTTILADEKIYHAKDGLPGETVIINPKRKGNADVMGVNSSPYEKVVDCELQERCGGCRFRDIKYEDEKKIKLMELEKLASMLDGVEFLGLETPETTERYRNKMEYTFGDEEKGGSLKLGLHERGKFHNILEATDCKLVPHIMDEIKIAVREFAEETGLPHYHRFKADGFFRHLVIRHSVTDDKYLLNLVTTSKHELDTDALIEKLESKNLMDKIASIYNTTNDSLSDAIVPEAVTKIYGEDSIYENVCGVRFEIGPFSFFQTNTKAAEDLYSYVKTMVQKVDTIWDLYAGSAVIGAIMSDCADEIYSVEINPANVEDAKKMLEANNISNVHPILGDCKEFVLREDKADLIIVDPPRVGLHPKVVEAIDNSGVEKIIYVSCNPVTAVSDINAMQNYSAKNFKAFDNFRGTLNIESVFELVRK